MVCVLVCQSAEYQKLSRDTNLSRSLKIDTVGSIYHANNLVSSYKSLFCPSFDTCQLHSHVLLAAEVTKQKKLSMMKVCWNKHSCVLI